VDNTGWTITLWNQLDGPDAIVTETNGFDYVLDLISEMELAPAFPAAKHMFLEQRKNSLPPIKKREVRRFQRQTRAQSVLFPRERETTLLRAKFRVKFHLRATSFLSMSR